MFISSSNIFNFLFTLSFISFISCSLVSSSFFYLIQYIFKTFYSTLEFFNHYIFLWGCWKKRFFRYIKKLTVCFDLILKSFYLFISDSSDSGDLYSVKLHSIDNCVPIGKLNFLFKNQIINIKFRFSFHCW